MLKDSVLRLLNVKNVFIFVSQSPDETIPGLCMDSIDEEEEDGEYDFTHNGVSLTCIDVEPKLSLPTGSLEF